MPEASNMRVVVTVHDEHLTNIQQVANALRAAGMSVSNVLPIGGVITGEIAKEKRNQLSSITGVTAVEPDEEMHTM